MLCFGVECKNTQTLYVVLYNLVDLEGGSIQVHLQKALLVKKNSKFTSVVGRIRHCLYDKKSYKRECNCRSSRRSYREDYSH